MKESRIPDFITSGPQRFFWRLGMRRTGNAFSSLRYRIWCLGGGSWDD